MCDKYLVSNGDFHMSFNIQRAINSARDNVIMDRTGDYAQELAFLVRLGQKINAIKKYRAATGMGLKESKDFVEAFEARIGGCSIEASPQIFLDHFDAVTAEFRDVLLRQAQRDLVDLRSKYSTVLEERDELLRELDLARAELRHCEAA